MARSSRVVYCDILWYALLFFKQKTAYEMRISDWSSDVCSSDLPSKALLHASELYEEAASGALEKFGVKISGAVLDIDQMHAEKNKAVGELTGGIEYLFKKNKIDWLKGHAAFQNPHTVEVSGKSYTARNIVIATGSSVPPLPGEIGKAYGREQECQYV